MHCCHRERSPKTLQGKLDKRFGAARLEPGRMGDGGLISRIGLGEGKTSGDVLGEVYQDFLGQSPVPRARKGAVLHPCPQGETLVALLAPHKGLVYDPCCGSGGMFVQSEQFVNAMGAGGTTSRFTDREAPPHLAVGSHEPGRLRVGRRWGTRSGRHLRPGSAPGPGGRHPPATCPTGAGRNTKGLPLGVRPATGWQRQHAWLPVVPASDKTRRGRDRRGETLFMDARQTGRTASCGESLWECSWVLLERQG